MKRVICCLALGAAALFSSRAFALSSVNIPLNSPIYLYLEKLSGLGLIRSDIRGIRPYSKSEAARLLAEAKGALALGSHPPLADELVARLTELLPREAALRRNPAQAPAFDWRPVESAKLRYVYLDGAPRSYFRAVHDPGGDGVFGIGSGLRPRTPYPYPVQQRGTEGTPLFENNEGVVYHPGHNLDLRFAAEAYLGSSVAAKLEPELLWSEDRDTSWLRINQGYLKLGGEGAELEVGRDENWLGLGFRGAITLTNNARNFDLIKLSSPEPIRSRYLWDLKYDLIFSRFERTVTDGEERQPFFVAAKLSMKPTDDLEFGVNLARQVGGAGVNNSLGDTVRGLIGGTTADNSNSVAGCELRYRMPWLRDSELYGEFSGEDAADFWPIVESYVAGFYLPRLTADGRDDLRFEYFLGNQILYTNGTFPEGYLHYGLPVGHSQGGATQEFFLRYSHWFSARNNLALEGYRTSRGDVGRMTVNAAGQFDPNGTMQTVERKLAWRAFWRFAVAGDWDATLMYGRERIENLELRQGEVRTNQLVRAELTYRR